MSWTALEPILRTATPEVREAVRLISESRDSRSRQKSLRKLSKILGSGAGPLILQLARHPSIPARQLALDLVARLRRRAAVIHRAAQGLVSDRAIPRTSRIRATRAMLRDLRHDPKRSMRLLRQFVAGLGRAKALERLDRLAPRLGVTETLMAKLRAELANRQRLSCPRCGVMRRRRRMADHLWKRHRLILEGRRALTTWQAIDERVSNIDPVTALDDFHRTMLRRGHFDEQALDHLQHEAAQRHETICPKCYCATAMPDPPLVRPLEVSHGRIAGDGFAITIDEHGLRSHVRLDSRSGTVYEGAEPQIGFTPRTLMHIALAIALAAFAAAALSPSPWHLLIVAALVCLVLAVQAAGRRAAERGGDPTDRAVNHAWERMAPIWRTSPILDRLAVASVGRGDPQRRSREIENTIEERMKDKSERRSDSSLSALWWLHAMDRGEDGDDIVHELAARLDECFAGRAPMVSGAGLLELTQTDLRPRSERARLRVLVCAAAFARGYSIGDLVELGRAFPSFAQSLATDDLDSLASLQVVWELREEQPWREHGPVINVFEMARYPSVVGPSLWSVPDLLLYLPLPPAGPDSAELPVFATSRGVIVGESLLREVPEHIWVWRRPAWHGSGFELRLEPHRMSYIDDPTALVPRLRKWLEFSLHEFLPRAESIPRYRTTGKVTELLSARRTECPSCGETMVPVVGHVGLAHARPE